MIIKKIIPGAGSRLSIVDHNESYGRRILEKVIKNIKIEKCLDIGSGLGDGF